jgi:hypothetical protein
LICKSNRSWEDHFEGLLKFKECHNSSISGSGSSHSVSSSNSSNRGRIASSRKLNARGIEWALLLKYEEKDNEIQGYDEEEEREGGSCFGGGQLIQKLRS